MLSTSQIISTSIGMCDAEIRSTLYNNIMVIGGNSFIKVSYKIVINTNTYTNII